MISIASWKAINERHILKPDLERPLIILLTHTTVNIFCDILDAVKDPYGRDPRGTQKAEAY